MSKPSSFNIIMCISNRLLSELELYAVKCYYNLGSLVQEANILLWLLYSYYIFNSENVLK